ncbi:serin endopeptidase [Niveomyces insectorum RCEF 264]|uniref:Serin endopeptidase n=1 Tax=Niveomyces insectorum RCEF 264 TaxID=1081102 RepID=A0A167LU10_9HYPO|nr:serin endopeptidase [Niveomyces insectorum RCEF 264]
MHLVGLALALSAGLEGAHALRHGQPAQMLNATVAAAKRFIVEFADGADHQATIDSLAARHGTRVLKTFKTDVFSGASIETTADNIDTLRALTASVSQVWSSNKIHLDPIVSTQSFSSDAAAPQYSVHNWTGVDKVHAAGYFGKGAVVAIVDTGTQYTHPALGGGFGPGYKVAGGYDFVGDGIWPYPGEEKHPDKDPMDQIGHGTHVAGIIAGKSDQFVGVAPEATLLSYKVFGQVDGTDEDTLIEAFLAAYEADADIITSSVGGAGGWATDAWATVASRLVKQGIVVTIAAGNNGDEGPFFGSNGASGEYVLAVASTEASTLVAPPFEATFHLNGTANTTKLAYYPGLDAFPATVQGWPIVPLTLNTSVVDDACAPLPSTTQNLSSVVALVRRGGCNFYDKQQNLEAFGAQYILFYQDDEALVSPFSFDWDSLLGVVEKAAGEAIIDTYLAGGHVTADFSLLDPNTNYVGMYNAAGGRPNDYTSYGSTYDLRLKPEIAAPGGDIFSTYPTDGWAVLSGTSMATPYIAGVAALYVGRYGGGKVHGKGFAKDLAMRIIASGGSLPWIDGVTETDYGVWAPTVQVGSGLVDAHKVLTYNTSLSYAKFALNDTHHFERYHPVDITNHGDQPVTYKFQLQDAAGFEAWQPQDDNVEGSPRPKMLQELTPAKMTPKVTFPGGTFTVKPGETKRAQFNFDYPTGLTNIPVYSGKILIVGSNGEQLSIPYFGIASNLEKDLQKQFQQGYPQGVSGINYPFLTFDNHSAFTFNLDPNVQDFPRISARTQWGIKELRWDIFDGDWTERHWTYPPVVGQNGYVGTVAYYAQSGYVGYFDPAVDNATDTIAFPLSDIYRSSFDVEDAQYWWFGQLGNGSQIAPGNYTLRFGVLAPFGTPEHSDNWDVLEHKFSVVSN